MDHRAAAASLLTVIATVTAAFALGIGVEAAADAGRFGVPMAVMTVVAVVFAVRAPEGLAAFGVTVLLAESVAYWTGVDVRYVDEAGLPLLAAVTLVVHRRRLRMPPLALPELGLLVVLAAGIASSLANDVPVSTWVLGLALLAKGVAFFYLVWLLNFDAAEIRRLAVGVLAVALPIIAIGLVQFAGGDAVTNALRLPPTGRPRGDINVVGSVFTHPALYGWLAAFVSLLLYARFAILRDRLALALALVANLGTLVSGRRSPVIGVVAALLAGAARQVTAGRRLGRVWAMVAAGVLALTVVSVPFLGDFYASTLERYGARPAVVGEVFTEDPDPLVVRELQPRVALYAASLAIARDMTPLGAGIGRFASHLSRETYSPIYAAYGLDRTFGLREANPRAVTDTFWPMILGETGAFGLLGAVLFFAGLGVRLWRAAGRDATPAVRAITLAALLVFIEALVRSLISQALIAPPITYLVFGTAALALGLDRSLARVPGAAENEYSVGGGTPLATVGGEPQSRHAALREHRDA